MSESSNNHRLQYIDFAKGIAIICIILGHLGNSDINRFVFTFHVPIFFLLTGYFISRKRSVKDFVFDKARKLLVPYVVACLTIIIIGTVWSYFRQDGSTLYTLKYWIYASLYGAGDSYTEPFWIPGIGAIWFLLATFFGGGDS